MTTLQDSDGTGPSTVDLCWNCNQPIGREPFCPHCTKLQPVPESADYFGLFGLESGKMEVDVEGLEAAFYALTRQVHPDRYQGRGPRELRIAEERAAALNVAYRTLRDPVARAEYLLALEGGSSAETPERPSAELLVEVMEVQETVEAFRASREADRPILEDSLKEAQRSLDDRCRQTMSELGEAFATWDRQVVRDGNDAARGPLLSRFRELVNQERYFATTLKDVQAALAGEPAPARQGR